MTTTPTYNAKIAMAVLLTGKTSAKTILASLKMCLKAPGRVTSGTASQIGRGGQQAQFCSVQGWEAHWCIPESRMDPIWPP